MDTGGNAQKCVIHSSSPEGLFDGAALAAARNTRFIISIPRGICTRCLLCTAYQGEDRPTPLDDPSLLFSGVKTAPTYDLRAIRGLPQLPRTKVSSIGFCGLVSIAKQ